MDDPRSVISAIEIANSALNGEKDILVACRELVSLRSSLPSIGNDVFDTFVGVESEIDDLPLGSGRQYWNAEILREKDNEATDYREQVKGAVREALSKLLNSLGT